jgi:hypothetical protein
MYYAFPNQCQKIWVACVLEAILKVTESRPRPLQYDSAEEAKMAMLQRLCMMEGGNEYKWPDFGASGFDSGTALRLQRAMIHEAFNAMVTTKMVSIGTKTVSASGKPSSQIAEGNIASVPCPKFAVR